MLRSSLIAVSALSLVALIAACATSPSDPIDDKAADQSATDPTDTVKLPPPSQGDTEAGEPKKDSGASSSSSSSSSSGSSGTPDAGSSSSSSSSSSGGGGGACDMSNTLYLVQALAELNKASPRTCSMAGTGCQPTECCFSVYMVCVDQ